jgi:LacI family transcriptional regulator
MPAPRSTPPAANGKQIKPTKKSPQKKTAAAGRVTLRQIAEKLGVSRMTVSLALRDDPHVAAKTRARVQAAAKRAGFTRDAVVSKLMSEVARLRTSSPYRGEVAFLTAWPTALGWKKSHHFSGCFEGARARARELGYQLTNLWVHDPSLAGKQLSKVLWSRGIRGIILVVEAAEFAADDYTPPDIQWDRFCVVHLGASHHMPNIHSVRHDHFQGMLCCLENLERLGYRRIGLALVESADILTHNLWTAAYLHWRAMRNFRRALPGFVYPYGDFPADRFSQWVVQNDLDAVVAIDEEPLKAVRRISKSISRPVGLCSLDHTGKRSPVAGVDQGASMIGRTAMDQLVHGIHHDSRGLPRRAIETFIRGTWRSGRSAQAVGPVSPIREGGHILPLRNGF